MALSFVILLQPIQSNLDTWLEEYGWGGDMYESSSFHFHSYDQGNSRKLALYCQQMQQRASLSMLG
jgi:hypothetical protein